MQEIQCTKYRFAGLHKPALTASGVDGPWVKADTSVGGAPTVQAVAGAMELTLAADNEAENICLYFGDVLPYDIDDLVLVEIWARLTAAVPAAVMGAFGLAGARNDTLDSVAQNAWFRFEGNNNIVVETDDGTLDLDDKATGLTLSTTIRKFTIDFGGGIVTAGPPAQSEGGKNNVLFSMENGQGLLRPVARGTQFDMGAYAGGLQLFAQLQKTAAVSVATLGIWGIDVHHRTPA